MRHALWTATAAVLLSTSVQAQNLAIVNGKPVPSSRLEAVKQQFARSGRPVAKEMEAQLKDEVIMREILAQEAQSRGLHTTTAYRDQVELARQTLLIRELIADEQKKTAVSDAEIKSEYDKFAAANAKEYRASHVLVDKEDEAKAIIESLKKGGSFSEIAKKQSKDTGSGERGGDLDWATPGSYVPEFSGAMVKLTKGQVTETPVRSKFGFHVIRLDDVRDVTDLPKLDEVKAQIRQQLEQQRMAQFQDRLRSKAKVQ
jgi:peptidyl-prolyl cis-trans isomerase C